MSRNSPNLNCHKRPTDFDASCAGRLFQSRTEKQVEFLGDRLVVGVEESAVAAKECGDGVDEAEILGAGDRGHGTEQLHE
jgi:hypothetical protein